MRRVDLTIDFQEFSLVAGDHWYIERKCTKEKMFSLGVVYP